MKIIYIFIFIFGLFIIDCMIRHSRKFGHKNNECFINQANNNIKEETNKSYCANFGRILIMDGIFYYKDKQVMILRESTIMDVFKKIMQVEKMTFDEVCADANSITIMNGKLFFYSGPNVVQYNYPSSKLLDALFDLNSRKPTVKEENNKPINSYKEKIIKEDKWSWPWYNQGQWLIKDGEMIWL
jgi:hypothetical protein